MTAICKTIIDDSTFRRVSKQARRAVDSIPEYSKILKHAPDSIRGALSVATGSSFSCCKLYEKLCTAECESCGDYGGYLYIITCRRVCFLCFTEREEYLPLIRKDAIRKFGLNVKDLAALPSMKSVPGRYPPRGVKCGTRLTLYDRAAARQAGIDLHGSAEAMEQSASQISSQRLERYESRRLLRSPRDNSSLRQPRGNNEFDGLSSNPRRFMGLVRVPRINPRTGSLEWGDHCLACKPYHYSRPLHWRRKFTPEGLQEHLNECGEIIQGKHVDQANRDS